MFGSYDLLHYTIKMLKNNLNSFCYIYSLLKSTIIRNNIFNYKYNVRIRILLQLLNVIIHCSFSGYWVQIIIFYAVKLKLQKMPRRSWVRSASIPWNNKRQRYKLDEEPKYIILPYLKIKESIKYLEIK